MSPLFCGCAVRLKKGIRTVGAKKCEKNLGFTEFRTYIVWPYVLPSFS